MSLQATVQKNRNKTNIKFYFYIDHQTIVIGNAGRESGKED